MFAYRHLFHAGNFADVIKHALLVRLLLALAKKPKPYCYIDTHAGIGRYDLTHEWARKNAEFADGIARLWALPRVHPLLEPYMQIVRAENPAGNLQVYPGSPLIARRLLRSDDRAVLSELNPKDFPVLKECFAHDRQVAVVPLDGYQTLKAHLPPKERRGLVLIDSSFDRAGEFARLVDGLQTGYQRFATGTFVLWYPLMAPGAVQHFERSLIGTRIRRLLKCELNVHPSSWQSSLRGCGLIVVNPPFGFDDEARQLMTWLVPLLQQSTGAGQVQWLVGE